MHCTPTHKAGLRAVITAQMLFALVGALQPASAQQPPTPLPMAAAIAAPQDKPYPGVITIAVDATDLDHRVLRVQQSLPVQPGRLTLLYPRWIPGHHGPTGDVASLAGLMVRAGEHVLAWQRDPLDPLAFHVEVPAGVQRIELSFQHITPMSPGDARVTMTRELLGVQWNQVTLYPAGHYASAIRLAPRVRLPAGWQQGSALRNAAGQVPQPGADGWVDFAEVSLETLIDSPLFAGRHFKRFELDPAGTPSPVALNVFADEPSQLEATPAQIQAHRALVQQSDKLFGARQFRHYDLLLALSGEFGGIGLEHHESSENGVRGNYFKEWDKAIRSRDLLPHEYTHSWDGKYRRPADLWTPQYNVPMQNSLLWVYEGQTQYWGHVLTPRSGLATAEQSRDQLAQVAAYLDHRVGRGWRSLQDTTNEATIGARGRARWRDWQRGVDYYDEATLIWLDADTLIREKSGGKRSLDDFAKTFFGVSSPRAADGAPRALTYTFDDVVRALAAVQPHDWAGFLRERLDSRGPGAPLAGLARSGWKLAYTEQESEFAKNEEGWGGASGLERAQDLQYSLGLAVASDGKLEQVVWDSPAFRAGLAPGLTLVAVNLEAYKADKLAEAVTANKEGKAPVQLLLREGDRYRNVTLDYRGGLRYPKLERIEGTPDRLSQIMAPR
ncbi:MAG TPA: peptidase M61 [Ideonella sp.]|nr:peptidase M61 [Ideonella sp.]